MTNSNLQNLPPEMQARLADILTQANAATQALDASPPANRFYAIQLDNNVVACGRLQNNGNGVGQIRYMAIDKAHQGQGLGKLIIKKLMTLKLIVIQMKFLIIFQ